MGGMLLMQEIAEPRPADCIVVLGCAVRGDTPSPMLARRLNRALEVYREGLADAIIVCGGKGKGENITEAEAMRKYLSDRGIEEGKVLLEDESTNTWANLANARNIMEEKGFKSALIVTSEFHLPRALSYAREMDIAASGAASKTQWHLRLYYSLREIASYVKHWITKK